MEGEDEKLYMDQHRNDTYSEVAKRVDFVQWVMAQPNLSTTCPCKTRISLLGSTIGTTSSRIEVCMFVAHWGYLREPMCIGLRRRGLGRPHLIPHLIHL